MKLLNKNTGRIGEGHIYFTAEGKVEVSYMADSNTNGCCVVHTAYDSISELSENFEIVKKTGPLIKDEKVRKAVRAWAEANNAEKVAIQNNYCLSTEDDEDVEIVFASPIFEDIDDDDFYTIAELCGEEEE